jgi:splicing factor U2AF 35 kDa subunit
MAEHLASIFGTEKDKINCPFYYKIGACRHGDRCSRTHTRPLFSPTLLLQNLYISPAQITARAETLGLPPPDIPAVELATHFDDFYEDVHAEMARYGRVDGMVVCENSSDHLAGNTYVKFSDEDSAAAALAAVNGRFYAGRLVHAEYSPVTELTDGKCRMFEEGVCGRGNLCHFMHTRRIPDSLYRKLYAKRPRSPESDDDPRRDDPRRDDPRRDDPRRDDRGRDFDRRENRRPDDRYSRDSGRDGRDYRDRDHRSSRDGHREQRGSGIGDADRYRR